MQRKITDNLVAWKDCSNRKPLMIFGARQIGKTTSVLEFGKSDFNNVVHIDFYKQPQLKSVFSLSLEPSQIIKNLEIILDITIDKNNTLIFFDEIQACEQALTSLKFFSSDAPEYFIITAGSLLGVSIARDGSFPVGYVDMLDMHPMDFEEFCWALGKNTAFQNVRESFKSFSECIVHDQMMDLYKQYLLVGGMPEAVLQFSKNNQLRVVRKIQSNILSAYIADMTKYASNTDSVKILASWNSIPAQLSKESGSTKFMWKYVGSGAKAERFQTAIDWLVAAGLVSKCTQVSCGVSPLKTFESPSSFKLYMLDTGLLANEYEADMIDFSDTGFRSATFRGGMAENYVMQQLCANDLSAYYWGKQSTYEVDFVIKTSDGIIPIEVKSGTHIKAKSAIHFAQKYDCPYVVHLSAKNFGETEQVKSIPLYAAILLDLL